MGGSFGGKPDSPCTAMATVAALRTGWPVRLGYATVTADTGTTPSTGPMAATRVTAIVGRAVQEGRRQMEEWLSGACECH